jgi:hypothetical protein
MYRCQIEYEHLWTLTDLVSYIRAASSARVVEKDLVGPRSAPCLKRAGRHGGAL